MNEQEYRYKEFNNWHSQINENRIRQPGGQRYFIPNKRPESPLERLDPNVVRKYMSQTNGLNENLVNAVPMFTNPQALQGAPIQSQQASPPQLLKDNVQWKDPSQVNNFNRPQQQQANTPYPQLQAQSRVCRLRMGAEFYRALPVANSPVHLCRQAGNIPGNWNVEFEIRNVVMTYPVGLNETRVDVMAIQRNPNLMKRMVEVGNPMIGFILVPENAIMNSNSNSMNNMLNDSNRGIIRNGMNTGIDPVRKKLFLG